MLEDEKTPKIGRTPLDGYDQIARQELAALKKLSVREAIWRLEMLLKEASEWRR